jgi:hypothetical protein
VFVLAGIGLLFGLIASACSSGKGRTESVESGLVRLVVPTVCSVLGRRNEQRPLGKPTNQSKEGSSLCIFWLANICLEQTGFIVRRCLLTGFLLLLVFLLPQQRGSVKVSSSVNLAKLGP